MSETKEQEMLARAKKGDQEAFAWLYEKYYRPGYAKACLVLTQQDDTHYAAEEAVQEAFMRCFMKIDTIQDKFGAYFFKAVLNCACNQAKKDYHSNGLKDENGETCKVKATVFSTLENDEEEVDFLDTYDDVRVNNEISINPELSLDANETKRYVREILDGITLNQQMALELHYIEQYSMVEIAEMLGTSEQNVKNWCFQGRKKAEKLADEIAKREGIQLRTIRTVTPFVFFLWMLCRQTEAYAAEIQVPAYHATKFVKGNGAGTPGAVQTAGTAQTAGAVGVISTKTIAIVSAVVIGAGAIGSLLWNNAHRDEPVSESYVDMDEDLKDTDESEEIEEVQPKEMISDSTDKLYLAGDWLAEDGSELSISMFSTPQEDGICGNTTSFDNTVYEFYKEEENVYSFTTIAGEQYTFVANAYSPEENARTITETVALERNGGNPSGLCQSIDGLESFGMYPATSIDLFIDGKYTRTYYVQCFFVS